MDERELLQDAADRAETYIDGAATRAVFPASEALDGLKAFDEPLPKRGHEAAETLALLDHFGSPATVVSNGPNYYGFVIGATLPAAAAAERLAAAWDQCAATYTNSPVADAIEKTAARWILDVLDLPRESGVAFGTSATSCGLVCLTTARRSLLLRKGWDFDADGLIGAPEVKVVVSEKIHVTMRKTLRILGFGESRFLIAPTDPRGRVIPEALPEIDDMTILCLQAGEVNTGEFDPFVPLVRKAQAAGAWVHVDGAFGLWARAAPSLRDLTEGIDGADSWTSDGHKWLNTPYDGAVGICRDAELLAASMNSDAAYSSASADSQKNLGIEFSRRARGIPIWAALRSLGREGVAEMVTGHCRQASRIADALRAAGIDVLNRCVLNQVLFRLGTDEKTMQLQAAVQASGSAWFGPTIWDGRSALRISVSSWRTSDADVERLIALVLKESGRL